MRALGKKLGALGLVLLMAVGTVACSDSSQRQAENAETTAGTTTAQAEAVSTEAATTAAQMNADGGKAVITVSGQAIPLSIAKYYVDYQKSVYEQYFSDYNGGKQLDQSEWYQTIPEKDLTYAQELQESCKDFLIDGVVVSGHAADYQIVLTEEEEQTLQSQAEQQLQTLGAEKAAAFGLTKEHLVDFLRNNQISDRIYTEVTGTFTCEISDEESRTVSFQIFAMSTEGSEVGGDDLPTMEEAKEKAEAVLARIQSGETPSEAVKELGTTVIDDTLSVGEFDDADEMAGKILSMKTGDVFVYENPEHFTLYGVYCVDEDDAAGREARKEQIRLEKAAANFQEMTEQWKKETEVLIDESLWGQLGIFES